MTQNQENRQIVKLSYWQYLRPAPKRYYPSGYYQLRAIYLCTLCNREYELSIQSELSGRSTCCISCAARKRERQTWLLFNLDTKKTIKVVNLKKWCKAHGVESSSLYRTQKPKTDKRFRNYATDNKNQRWKIRDKLN